MNIIYVVSSSNDKGGATKSFLTLLYGMIDKGVTPMVIVPDKGPLYQLLTKQKIRVRQCFYKNNTYPPISSKPKDIFLFIPRLCGRILANIVGTIQLYQITKIFHPSIIHTNTSVNNIGYLVARKLNIPHIWHIREYGDLDFDMHYLFTKQQQLKHYCSYNNYTICITKDIQVYNKLDSSQTSQVIYNGIFYKTNIEEFNTTNLFFLYAGRIEPAKGLIQLLEAYAIYAQHIKTPIPLYIAGAVASFDYYSQCQSIIAEHKIQNSIKFLGQVSDIKTLYKEACALVVPSISEGFGRITAEAMNCGCLVIGYDKAGTKEQFDNGLKLTGEEIALRYSNKSQLIKHLLDMTIAVQNQQFDTIYSQMIIRASKTVETLYSTTQYIQKIADFYESII